MYQYFGFGLNIASEIELPELYPADFEVADVQIAKGTVPEKLQEEKMIDRKFFSLTANEYVLNVNGVGSYYAGYGKTIIAEPADNADEHSVRLFLLGSVMAALLYQRGNIPLHASAIVKDGALILFTGNSGAGKSTLLAHLHQKGYEVFTDDICVLQQSNEGNKIYGVASYPMMKLWEDAIHKMGNEVYTKDFRIRPHLPKFGHFFHDRFITEAFPVSKLFVLHTDNAVKEISCRQLKGVAAFKLLEKQAYKQRMATGDKLRPIHFRLMVHLTRSLPVYEAVRPTSGITRADIFSDMIEQYL